MFSNRQARRFLQKLGFQMEELSGVEEVMLKLSDGRELMMRNPTTYRLKSKDLTILNIVGNLEEVAAEEHEVSLSEEDVQLVMQQTGVSREDAIQALVESEGDLAEAIIKLQGARSEG